MHKKATITQEDIVHKPKKPLVVITGPTATGKTTVGVLVAKATGGEIVSADSMLVYKGMDIGTAKPGIEEMQGVSHHMIDIVSPDQEYSVAEYQEQARAAIDTIHYRGNLPVVVGGTGLYIRSIIDNYSFASTGKDDNLRQKLMKFVSLKGFVNLHQLLVKVDPVTAAKLHPHDIRRIIRALEVYCLTGQPISSYHQLGYITRKEYDLLILGLTMSRDRLYALIEQRVDAMIEAGFVDEVRSLLCQGYSPETTSMRGLGYKEIISYLKGDNNLEQAIFLIKRNTRRFAKRQLTWFSRDNRIKWINIEDFLGPEEVAQEITRHVEGVLEGL